VDPSGSARNKHELFSGVSWWTGWAATPWPSASSYCQLSSLSPQNKPRISSKSRDQLNSPSHEEERTQTSKVRFKDHLNSKWGFLGQDKCINRVMTEYLYLKIYFLGKYLCT
jgi:hypothetical protein